MYDLYNYDLYSHGIFSVNTWISRAPWYAVMAYTGIASAVVAYTVMTYVVMAYIVIADIVMAYVVMACKGHAPDAELQSWSRRRQGAIGGAAGSAFPFYFSSPDGLDMPALYTHQALRPGALSVLMSGRMSARMHALEHACLQANRSITRAVLERHGSAVQV